MEKQTNPTIIFVLVHGRIVTQDNKTTIMSSII